MPCRAMTQPLSAALLPLPCPRYRCCCCRRLRTLYFSWFLNSPGAVLTIQDSIMVDPVCNATDSQQDLQSAQSLPQLPGKPRNVVTPSQPLCLALPTGTECFQHGVHMQMLTVVLGSASRADQDAATTPAQAAAAAAAGHFVIQYRNTTRVCRQYLDPQCLQENGGNRTLCWERAFTGQQQDGSRAGPSSAGGAAMTTGAIAGAVVGGACSTVVAHNNMLRGTPQWLGLIFALFCCCSWQLLCLRFLSSSSPPSNPCLLPCCYLLIHPSRPYSTQRRCVRLPAAPGSCSAGPQAAQQWRRQGGAAQRQQQQPERQRAPGTHWVPRG